MSIQPSPFVTVGRSPVRRPDGRTVVPVFRADRGDVVMLPAKLADCLRTGRMEDVGAADLQNLTVHGLVGDPEQIRNAWYARLGERDEGSHREYVLLPTSYCNMACTYCGQEHTKVGLSRDHRALVRRRVLDGLAAAPIRTCHVAWFGGEPLMAFAAIRAMAPDFVAAAREHGVSYSSKMTTNGALLDQRKLRVLIDDCGVDRFDITIDGPADIHDDHRPMKSGRPTWHRLVDFLAASIRLEENSHVRFVLRTNVDRRNADHVSRYLRTMASKGFSGARNVTFQVAPIHSWGNDISALAMSRPEAVARETRWLAEMVALGLNTSLLPSPVTVTCTATDMDHEVIDANGDVYSCNEHPLVPGYEGKETIGTVESLLGSLRRPRGRFDDWYSDVAKGQWPCSTCRVLPSCGGACPKLWHEGIAPCPTFKDNLPDRLTLHAAGSGVETTAGHATTVR